MNNQEAPPGSPETVGAYLRHRRMRRNIDLDEVSAATGITSTVLQALENENRAQLPAEVYIKAFYKKYAEYLGIDAAEILAKYQKQAQDLKKVDGKYNFSTVVTLKGQAENIFAETLRRLLLPIAILILGVVLYWIYKNYLAPYNPVGFYREQSSSVIAFVLANPSVFWC